MPVMGHSLCVFGLHDWHYCSDRKRCVFTGGHGADFTGLWLERRNADEGFIRLSLKWTESVPKVLLRSGSSEVVAFLLLVHMFTLIFNIKQPNIKDLQYEKHFCSGVKMSNADKYIIEPSLCFMGYFSWIFCVTAKSNWEYSEGINGGFLAC